MTKQEYECIVCGKRFNEGQGIVLTKGSLRLTFHSNKCASKFFKLYLERLDESCAEKSGRDLVKELEKIREEKEKQTKKVIS